MRGRVSVALKRAGWVEATQVGFSRLAPLWCRSRASPRSVAETHHCHGTRTIMGFVSLNPSYGLMTQVCWVRLPQCPPIINTFAYVSVAHTRFDSPRAAA